MVRGPSITTLLVEHLGLPKSDLKALRTDIGGFLKQRVNIRYALDHEIAEVARLYMASSGAIRYFSSDVLNYRWSSDVGQAVIEKTVREVMLVQQAYAIEQIHRGHGDCPGCRYDPLPSQPKVNQAQPGLQQQPTPSTLWTPLATNVLLSQQPPRPRPTYSHEVAGNHADDPSPFSINTAAINEDDSSDSDYHPRKRLRTSAVSGTSGHRTPQQAIQRQLSRLDNDTISVRQKPFLSRTSTATSSLGMETNHGIPAVQGTPSISANLRGKTWNFRSHEHQSEVLAAISTWQAEEMNKVLQEAGAGTVAYLARALRYEREIEDLFIQSGAESADS